jgi:hypothetical protein
MAWHVYEIPKPESTFAGIPSYSDFKQQLLEDAGIGAVDLLKAELDDALGSAREAGWKGTVQGEPHIFTLPVERIFEFGFVWKGERTTIIAPRALPWMTPLHVAQC